MDALGTDPQTLAYIEAHLDEDLELITGSSTGSSGAAACPIHFALPAHLLHNGLFQCSLADAVGTAGTFLVLQVVAVEDISLSMEQRCRALAAGAGAISLAPPDATEREGDGDAETRGGPSAADAVLRESEEAEEAAQQQRSRRTNGGRWRQIKLTLTDGFTRVLAMEHRRGGTDTAALFPEGIALGAKIRISCPFTLTHGVLRLSSDNTTLLGGTGGGVRALQVFWESQAQRYLQALTGRPSKQTQGSAVEEQVALAMEEVLHQQQQQRHIQQQQQQSSAPESAPPIIAQQLQQQGTHPVEPTALVMQPLEQWTVHVTRAPGHPFLTQGVITEVVSDLLINEYAAPQPASRPVSVFSLLVQLSSPSCATAASQAAGSTQTQSDSQSGVVVDLGHQWLLQLVGMPAEAFRELSLSQNPRDAEVLASVIARVGQELENHGVGAFVLQQRSIDGVVEVVEARRLQ